jgi:hypothetical protein
MGMMIAQPMIVMRIDPIIKRAMDEIPVAYEIIKTKDHYFLKIGDHPRVIIAGNHGRSKHGEIVTTVRNIHKLIKHIQETTND